MVRPWVEYSDQAAPPVTVGEVVMRPAVVVSLLPGRHRHEATARYAYDLPCSRCSTPLVYSGAHQLWRCDGCAVSYGRAALAKVARG